MKFHSILLKYHWLTKVDLSQPVMKIKLSQLGSKVELSGLSRRLIRVDPSRSQAKPI